ncbi:chromosome loss- protein [Collariella sp. IMI 366227]|nr:chromosome loss- protein [Collariella sp. IMI 366227]
MVQRREGQTGAEENEDEEERVEEFARGGRKSQVNAILERTAGDDDDEQQEDDLGEGWRPYVRLTFHGSHVFGGVRQLVENGIIDGERMPGWLTGEDGVTIGAVRNGRIRGHKGSGV